MEANETGWMRKECIKVKINRIINLCSAPERQPSKHSDERGERPEITNEN